MGVDIDILDIRKMDIKKKKARFIEALKQNGGIICKACEAANIGRATFYVWKDNDAIFAEQCREVEESMIDFVENALIRQIKEGDTTATIFYLKTKGKSRGYVEKTQVEGKLETNLNIGYVKAEERFASNENEIDE